MKPSANPVIVNVPFRITAGYVNMRNTVKGESIGKICRRVSQGGNANRETAERILPSKRKERLGKHLNSVEVRGNVKTAAPGIAIIRYRKNLSGKSP